jgi:hypothetical protein
MHLRTYLQFSQIIYAIRYNIWHQLTQSCSFRIFENPNEV